MDKYVDGYILAVPEDKLEEYTKLAKQAGDVWRKHGALEYYECVGDDLDLEWSGIKFPQTVEAKAGELVIFSFIVYKSREHRDQVNEKVHQDPLMSEEWKDKPMPFDLKRMVCGGFKVIVEA